MKLQEVFQNEKREYNQFVATNDGGSFLQSWEWGEWQTSLGRQVIRFKFQDLNGETSGVMQFIKTSLPFGKYYLYAPYGPVVDQNFKFQISNFKLLQHEIQKLFPDAMFVRIEPTHLAFTSLPPSLKKTTNIQPGITIVADLQKSEEELLGAMHPKTRYNIRVAEKHGVEIQSELAVTPQYGLYTKEVVDLVVQTQERHKYKGHSALYYKDFINFFALKNSLSDLKVTVYRAVYNKELLASAIMVDFGKTRMYLYGGSSDSHRNVMAPYKMHWQAMLEAKKMGITTYDFGGSEVSSGGEKGFTRFKQGFGGSIVRYAGAYDFVLHKLWYTIYTVLRKLNRLVR